MIGFERGFNNDSFTVLWPKSTIPELIPHVPDDLFQLYAKSVGVLDISPEASAALSRRIIEQVLAQAGYKQDKLYAKIEEFRNHSDTPLRLRDNIDFMRKVGNWAVHTTHLAGEIVDVEQGEAEWALELVQDLFEHFYVLPAKDAIRREAINAKRTKQ